jgi:hypothetical protein
VLPVNDTAFDARMYHERFADLGAQAWTMFDTPVGNRSAPRGLTDIVAVSGCDLRWLGDHRVSAAERSAIFR